MFGITVRTLVAALVLCSTCGAQIKLSEQKLNTYVGFESPRVVNGMVVAGPNSKPTLAGSTSTIIVEKVTDYKFVELEAEGIPGLEIIELEQIEGGYRFPDKTPPGSYRVTARAYDPGIATKRLMVEVSAPKPVDPIDPPVDPLTGLPGVSRKAIVTLVQSMASDMKLLADDAKAGRVKTVLEASNANNTRDNASRITFKTSMAKVMEPLLGTEELPPNAPDVFSEIAKGFGAVK